MNKELMQELYQYFGETPELLEFDESLYEIDMSRLMTSAYSG